MALSNVKIILAGGLFLGALALSPIQASAAPMLDPGLAAAAAPAPAGIENARWVCGPWRCWWRPNYYYRPWGYYGWHRPWGWHRGWGWHGGWHRGWGWHGGWHRGWGWHGGWHRGWRRW